MALPLLVNGADCGPVNPLQSLGKRFDQDRGLQQDLFGPGRASSSRQNFRTPQSAAAGFEQDAARFFSGQGAGAAQIPAPAPFSMGPLHHALPAAQPVTAAPAVAAPAWAADFLAQQPALSGPSMRAAAAPVHAAHPMPMEAFSPAASIPTFQPRYAGNMSAMGVPSLAPTVAHPQIDASHPMWDAPLAQHPVMAAPAPQSQSSAEGAQRARPDDDLARTAGILLESVAHDTRAKFQQSAFLGLMRQLRDGDVVVDGDRMVPRSEAAGADVKGKGKARAAPSATMGGLRGWTATANADTSAAQADGAEDAYWRQENAEYSEYWRGMARGAARVRFGGAQDAEWGHLQDDWDAFEATAAGVRPVARYQFQAHNPYVRGGPSTATRQHALHAGGHGATYDNVLQMEAAVQRAPGSADAWCALGVRQQEAEREQKAIQALERALALDPAHQAARLGLAVSLTNEGNRAGAVAALHAWVTRHARFGAARTRPTDDEGVPRTERATALVNCLLEMARAAPEGEVDADMQIAMAVLLNTNEEWEKSGDCFNTALHVRPEDWLLWNRVGATLANSGHAEEALTYYAQALQLNPLYIRARYNMGIALANLRRYGEAAEYFFHALVMQESDATRDAAGGEDRQGLTSHALWDSLKAACSRMDRLDLAAMCERHDLDAFRRAFESSSV